MRTSHAALLTGTAVLLAALTACGGDAADQPAASSMRIYGADGNMSNSFGEQFREQPGLLAGMKGTIPLTPLSESFRTRLTGIDGRLTDFSYAAEAYDAVVISAVAAEIAGSANPRRVAAQITGVTAGGELCDTVAACLKLARAKKDLRYRGISLRRSGFTQAGEPSSASYATLHFGERDRIDDAKTEFVGAGDETTVSQDEAPATGGAPAAGPLRIGGLLPKTGAAALLYPRARAGAQLALREINAAGGSLGAPVQWLDRDDGTDPETARRSLADLVAAQVSVVIGPGTSGVAREILPDVVRAGVVLFSPSNTAADLTNVEDAGLYFRTAPSDVLQGRALADVIMRDGAQRVVIVARDDAYGTGLQNNVRQALLNAGRTEDHVKALTYRPAGDKPVDFTGGAAEIREFRADAVLVVGLVESAAVIKAMATAGLPIIH
ncbi:hypothetical protein GCM10010124_30670 [Pilimelia terevasa]|uniref:Leucine-binding protein domain-containing protein n=1 Tax=Pilimelia terevasa TaxID=53372 RepID=A0A8J3FK16_9ACTN|nr:ABC transporter substrate-binding protein [Pilimelia terevasa]GGK35870.1 hypothetical protein GCM10010124_30670 [Pilimelia terevasa]